MTTTRIVVILLIFVFPFLWELYGAITSDISLISPVLRDLGRGWNGIIIYAVNVVQGHVWVSPPWSIAEYINEYTELGIVIFTGWIIFWAFETFDETLTPMNTLGAVSLIVFSLCMGAFFWTMTA